MFLENRVALVTGGSRGIGRAVALALARQGARVAINYYPGQQEEAKNTQAEISSLGVPCQIIPADIGVREEVDRMVSAVEEAFGAPDILVNNAGITRDQLLLRMKDEDWHQVLTTDLTGVFYCCRAVLKYMLKKRWGRIVNIASVVGITGNAGQTNYSAAKAGVIGFTKSLAREAAGRGINVNAVAPGFIETGMTAGLPKQAREEFIKRIPLGRPGKPEEVAEVVVFLTSSGADYITGHTIPVDGGMII